MSTLAVKWSVKTAASRSDSSCVVLCCVVSSLCDLLCPSSLSRSLWEPSRSLLGIFSFCQDVESDAGSPTLDSVPSSRAPVHQCEYLHRRKNKQTTNEMVQSRLIQGYVAVHAGSHLDYSAENTVVVYLLLLLI